MRNYEKNYKNNSLTDLSENRWSNLSSPSSFFLASFTDWNVDASSANLDVGLYSLLFSGLDDWAIKQNYNKMSLYFLSADIEYNYGLSSDRYYL